LICLGHLNPKKLHVRVDGVMRDVFALPRCYTLTHSDRTGDLYLTIGSNFDCEQFSGWYTRLMRDEVLAEWKLGENQFSCMFIVMFVAALFLVPLRYVNGSSVAKWRVFWKQFDMVTANFLPEMQGLIKLKYSCIFESQKLKTAKLNKWAVSAAMTSVTRRLSDYVCSSAWKRL
jgi:hypothetical protein